MVPSPVKGACSLKTDSLSHAVQLQEWIDNGYLTEHYTDVLQRSRRGPSAYTAVLGKRGEAAAEAHWDAWNNDTRLSDIAHSIEPIGRGLLEVVKADVNGERCHLVDIGIAPECSLMKATGGIETWTSVFVNKLSPSGGLEKPPTYAGIFAPDGHLGLLAVTLRVDTQGEKTQLGLFLSPPSSDIRDKGDDHVLLILQANGMGGACYAKPVGPTDTPSPISDFSLLTRTLADSGFLHGATGLPYSTHDVVDVLPLLGTYLSSYADMLRKQQATS
jgi:hypothetical protein